MRISTPFHRSIGSRGRAIYRKKIRHLVEPHEHGRIVVIDVNSGDYEVADRDADATARLVARHPDAVTWAERVGYPTVFSIGGGHMTGQAEWPKEE